MCGGWCLSSGRSSRLLWVSIVLPRYAFSGIGPNDVLTLEAAEALSIGNQRNRVGGVCLSSLSSSVGPALPSVSCLLRTKPLLIYLLS